MGCFCEGQLPWIWGFILVGSLCQITGFVLPWWFVLMDGQYIGLWYFFNCRNGIEDFGNCTTFSFKDADTDSLYSGNDIVSLHEFSALQVLIAVGCGIILLALFTLSCLACSKSRQPEPFSFLAFLLFLSGFAVAASVGLFAWIQVNNVSDITGYSINGRSFPYCVVISGIGMVCALAAALCMVVMLCNWSSYEDSEDDYDDDAQSFHNFEKPRQVYDNSAYNQNDYLDRNRKSGYYDKPSYLSQSQPYSGYSGGRQNYDYGQRNVYPPRSGGGYRY